MNKYTKICIPALFLLTGSPFLNSFAKIKCDVPERKTTKSGELKKKIGK